MSINLENYNDGKIINVDSSANINDLDMYKIIPPPGIIIMWYNNSKIAPKGWDFCDGRTVKINGNPTVTPDLRAVIPLGYTNDYLLNSKGGEESVTLTATNIYHKHGISYPRWAGSDFVSDYNPSKYAFSKNYNESQGYSWFAGGENGDGPAKPHNNLPPFTVVNYLIKIDYP